MDSLTHYIKKNFSKNSEDEIKALEEEKKICESIEKIEKLDTKKDLEIFYLQSLKKKYADKVEYLTQQEVLNEIREKDQLNLQEVLAENIKAQNSAIELLRSSYKHANEIYLNKKREARLADAKRRYAELEKFGEEIRRKFQDDGVKEKIRLLEIEVKQKQEDYEKCNKECENKKKTDENILKDLDREIEIQTLLIKFDEKAINEMEQELTNLDANIEKINEKNRAQEDEKNYLKSEIERLKNEKNMLAGKEMESSHPKCLTPSLDDLPDFNALLNSIKGKASLAASKSSSLFDKFMDNSKKPRNQKLKRLQNKKREHNTKFDTPSVSVPSASGSLSKSCPFSSKKIAQDTKEIQIGKNHQKATNHHENDCNSNNSGLSLVLPTVTEKNVSSVLEQKSENKIRILKNVRIKSPLPIVQKNTKNSDGHEQQLLSSSSSDYRKPAAINDKTSKFAVKRKIITNKSIAESPTVKKKKSKITESDRQQPSSCGNFSFQNLMIPTTDSDDDKKKSSEQNINEKLKQHVQEDEGHKEDENKSTEVNFNELFAAFTAPAEELRNDGVGILANDTETDDDLNMMVNFDSGNGCDDQSNFFYQDDHNHNNLDFTL